MNIADDPRKSLLVYKVMRSNKSSGTNPEKLLSKLLRKKILKNDLPGRPDFIYRRQKVAIFVHGCFWHRCPKCKIGLPKINRAYWKKKFETNVKRDSKNRIKLEKMGWRVLEIWEHELYHQPKDVLELIRLVTN